jgi:hypothetical protein
MRARVRIHLGTWLMTLAALVVPGALGAQTVDEIVARHVAARGGREALAGLRTLRMTGRAVAGSGREAVVRREWARPGRIRTEFVFQGTTGVYAWDGERGFQVSPLDGDFEPRPLGAEAAALMAEQADLEGPLVDFRAKGHELALVGRQKLPGGDAHELAVTLKSGARRRLWVDAASGLVVRAESTRKLRSRELTIETLYGDYRAADGVQFARTIEIGQRGRPQRLRITVETVETNPAIEGSRFQEPR